MVASSKQGEILFIIQSSHQNEVCKPKGNTEASTRPHKNSEKAKSMAKNKYPYESDNQKPAKVWTVMNIWHMK